MTHEYMTLRQRLNFCLRLQLLLLSAWRLLAPGTVCSFPCMLAVAPARFQLQEGDACLPCRSPAARPAPGSAVNTYWMNFKKLISSMPPQSQPSNPLPPQMSPTFSFIIWVLLLSCSSQLRCHFFMTLSLIVSQEEQFFPTPTPTVFPLLYFEHLCVSSQCLMHGLLLLRVRGA